MGKYAQKTYYGYLSLQAYFTYFDISIIIYNLLYRNSSYSYVFQVLFIHQLIPVSGLNILRIVIKHYHWLHIHRNRCIPQIERSLEIICT